MTKLEAALLDLSGFLGEHRIPYMIIGGFASLYWGVERFTRDLDLTIEVGDDALEDFLRQIAGRYALADGDPLNFVRRNHLIRIETQAGVPVDLMLAVLPYQVAAIRRAVPIRVEGRNVQLCAPEDLIIYKLASERPQDALDVEGIVLRQSARLERPYLAARVRELATGLDRPGIVAFYDKLLEKADSLPS